MGERGQGRQLRSVDRASEAVPLFAPRGVPLPVAPSSFVGRQREQACLAAAVRGSRLVTVIGPGGVGKTRLAALVADRLSERFAGPVRFVELAAVADPTLVSAAVGASVGLDDRTGISPTVLGEFLARARMLLVVDNCEHLLPAVGGVLVGLLSACPQLQVLATSRAPLGVPGETVFALAPLDVPGGVPEGPRTAEELAGSDAVELFRARGAAAAPGFAVTDENAAAVAALCRRLDGLPLAVELAARRLRAFGVDDLLRELDRRLDVLRAASAGGGRQHSVVASLDWSYELLSDGARVLWRRLAVLAGGATAESATAVGAGGRVAGDDMSELLAELVEHSILARTGEGRFQMLEVVRAYGTERLARAGERVATLDRLREYIRGWATRAAWWGADQGQVLARLEAEHANVIVVLEDAVARPEASEEGLVLAGELVRWWTCRGHLSEGRAYLEKLLARVPQPVLARYQALGSAAALAIYAGRLDEAEAHIEECLRVGRRLQQLGPYSRALPHAHAVTLRLAAGDTAGAAATAEAALALARHEGAFELTMCLEARARAAIAGGELAVAAALLQEALAVCERAGERWQRQRVTQGLGECAVLDGRLEEGAERLERCLASAVELGDWRGLAGAAEGLARVALERGDAETAARVLGAAEALWLLPGPLPAWWAERHEQSRTLACDVLGARRLATLGAVGAEMSVLDAWRGEPHAILHGQARAGHGGGEFARGELSERELEVLRLLDAPVSLPEIAGELFISPNTLKSHCRSLYRKLGVGSRAQAVARGREAGLIG